MDNQGSHLPRYKSLEETIQRLEISQRKREQQRSKQRVQKRHAESRKTLPALRPHSVPTRTRQGKRSPTAECNARRDVEDKQEAEIQRLLDEKMTLNKRFSSATSKEYRLQKQIRDKKSSLAVLKDQDNINKRRREMMKLCGEEQDILGKTNMQIAIQSHYTKTLNLMKDRLWLNQTTFQKTLEEYYVTLNAQKAEVADVTKMKENAALKLTKAFERNKKFNKLSQEAMTHLQRQLDGLRYMDQQQKQYDTKLKNIEKARKLGSQRRANETRAKSITSQMREATEAKKKLQLLEKLDEHEDALRKIQMASGLETDSEIIDAFNNRDAYLSDVVRKVDMLRRQLNEAQKRYNQSKAAFVSELIESDTPSSAALVVNVWGGKNDDSTQMELSNELLQQKRLDLQRVTREQAKSRELIIKFAQAVEGLYDSVAPMLNAKLAVEAFFTEEAAAAANPRHSKHRYNSRPGSKRGRGGRLGTPNKSRPSSVPDRHRHPSGASILAAGHLSQRMSSIEQIATQVSKRIIEIHQQKSDDEAAAAAQEKTEVEPEPDTEGEEKPDDDAANAEPAANAKPTIAIGPDYAEKIADFMRSQKFAVHNNIRVKSLPVATDTGDDRQSFFMKENKAQRDREQMEDMLDETGNESLQMEVDDDSEVLFDRESMKKTSISLVNKNTRKQRRAKKSKDDATASPKRATSAAPRRAGAMRSTGPGEN